MVVVVVVALVEAAVAVGTRVVVGGAVGVLVWVGAKAAAETVWVNPAKEGYIRCQE